MLRVTGATTTATRSHFTKAVVTLAGEWVAGETWIVNDPYTGGTHLPDITLVSGTELGFAVTRAHHADERREQPVVQHEHDDQNEADDPDDGEIRKHASVISREMIHIHRSDLEY